MRIFSPIVSAVGLTFGFSRRSVASETFVRAAIEASVSPALTVHQRGGFDFVAGWRGTVRIVTGDGSVGALLPESMLERMTTTAIVAARRKAAGAA